MKQNMELVKPLKIDSLSRESGLLPIYIYSIIHNNFEFSHDKIIFVL